MPKKQWKAAELVALLRERYTAPEYAFIEEARAGTGWKANRSADGLALSLWPSRGIYFSGFEIKVTRGDWRRELVDPRKAEEMAALCQFWWIVAPPGLVDPAELPETWGLLEPARAKLKAIRKAPKLNPKAITIDVIAALLRRVTEQYVPAGLVEARVVAEVERRTKYTRASLEHEKQRTAETLERLATFERVSGVRIDEWGTERIGEAVRYVRERGIDRVATDLERMADGAENIARLARDEASTVRAEVLGVAS